ncbi:MAG: 8-oxo-dGTP pyrophosphatase MutT (NUDIX family) [Crocinitomicaceae bacterium]|jgi:8-oxo-dGTP pyrophosphatase MutT (NUDIX family)
MCYYFCMLKKMRKKICSKICPKKKSREIVLVFPYRRNTAEMLIIKEYIHHYKRSYWKFVSGGVDKEETNNLMHASEELAEELGMHSDHLYHFHSSERIFGNRGTHFYVAEDPNIMENPPENPDIDFIEEIRWINESEFHHMLDTKELLWDEGTAVAGQVFRKYNINSQ